MGSMRIGSFGSECSICLLTMSFLVEPQIARRLAGCRPLLYNLPPRPRHESRSPVRYGISYWMCGSGRAPSSHYRWVVPFSWACKGAPVLGRKTEGRECPSSSLCLTTLFAHLLTYLTTLHWPPGRGSSWERPAWVGLDKQW